MREQVQTLAREQRIRDLSAKQIGLDSMPEFPIHALKGHLAPVMQTVLPKQLLPATRKIHPDQILSLWSIRDSKPDAVGVGAVERSGCGSKHHRVWRFRFELLHLQLQQQHFITRNRDETTRSRGLGTSAPLWQRLRASCPRTVFYNGPILDGAGNQCQTDLDLSAAMLATRKFWFQPPAKDDPEWADYLEQYKAQAQPWPHVPPPGAEDLVRTVLATNESSPGPDGIPYAA